MQRCADPETGLAETSSVAVARMRGRLTGKALREVQQHLLAIQQVFNEAGAGRGGKPFALTAALVPIDESEAPRAGGRT